MDNTYFKYQNKLTEFIKQYYTIFSIDNLVDLNDYIKLFEKKAGRKFMLFRSTWRFDNSILDVFRDKIVYYGQIQVENDNAIVGLIQVNDSLHLKAYLVWDADESQFFTGFDFMVTDMKDVIDFIEKYNSLVFNKEVQHAMGYAPKRIL